MPTTSLKTKQQLQQVLSMIEAPLVIVDASGTIEVASQKLCDMLGGTADGMEGRQFTDMFRTDLPDDRLIDKFQAAIKTSSAPWRVVLLAQTAAGRNIRLNATFSVIKPVAGHVSVLVLLSRIEDADTGMLPREQSTMAEVRSMVTGAAGMFAAGQLEMIGLEEVRMSLGDRWERLASKVYGIADSILKSHLSKEDVFRRDAQGNYIICFATLRDDAAWFKAKALGQEIREALLGGGASDRLAEFKLNAETRERLSGVRSASYEIDIPAEEFEGIPDVVGVINHKIGIASAELQKKAASLLRSLAETRAIRLIEVRSGDGKRVPVQRALFDASSEAVAQRLRHVYGDAQKLVRQLDTMLLGAVLEHMYQMDPASLPMVIIDVHFETLASPHSARCYYEVLGNAIGKPAQSLIINVRDIPDDLHPGRIAEVLRYLRNHSRHTSVRLTKPALGNINLAEARLSLATFDFSDIQLMLRRDPDAVTALFKQLRPRNVRVVINHIPGIQSLPALQEVKPDFYTMVPCVDEMWSFNAAKTAPESRR